MNSWVKKTLGFNDKWVMLIGIPIVTVMVSFIIFSNRIEEDFGLWVTKCIPVGLIYTTTIWMGLRLIVCYFLDKSPDPKDVLKRIPFQILSVFIGYFIIQNLVDIPLKLILGKYMETFEPHHDLKAIAGLLAAFMVVTVYEGIYFYVKLQQSIQETEQLQRENIHSQLEGLKNQVNPHFLFNSLNTLSHLIPEDGEKAVGFVQKLSKVYRYILEIRDKKIIPLSEELEFLNAYIFLLKERFGENIQIETDIPTKYLQKKIVPLSLQILFENAIKHNIISSSKPLTIKVIVEVNTKKNNPKLIVQNNLQKKKQISSSTKMGLENIKNRYQFFTDQTVDVIVTNDSFIVALPLIQTIKNHDTFQLEQENLSYG